MENSTSGSGIGFKQMLAVTTFYVGLGANRILSRRCIGTLALTPYLPSYLEMIKELSVAQEMFSRSTFAKAELTS